MLEIIGYALVKIAVFVLAFVMAVATLLTWLERKQSALVQDRIGPARANIGKFRLGGLLHILADGIKTFTKEDIIPNTPNPWLYKLAPAIAFAPPIILFAAGSSIARFPRYHVEYPSQISIPQCQQVWIPQSQSP